MDDLKNIIKEYIYNHPYPDSITRFLIRDWVVETKKFRCNTLQLNKAIEEVEKEFGVTFEEGSAEEFIKINDLINMPSPSRLIH